MKAEKFDFHKVSSLEEMREFLENDFPVGASKNSLHEIFANEGKARIHIHPNLSNTEKYLFDINLCRLYVWRWNISADFDEYNQLEQLYLNGVPVHAAGPQLIDPTDIQIEGEGERISKVFKPRPEADLGENELAFILYDKDIGTDDDRYEFVIGAGPSNPNPFNLGKLIVYENVTLWRSIFDVEEAWQIEQFQGTCSN